MPPDLRHAERWDEDEIQRSIDLPIFEQQADRDR
jgi:hypothetical protein